MVQSWEVPAAPPAQPAAPQPAAAPQAPKASQAPEAAQPPAEPAGTEVRAPIVGTFYEAASPDSKPYVQVGDTVKVGDVLCIIEAMKLMNEIESEVSGTVRKIMVKNATPVEYDQPLFIIEPS
jgi:acetyl-CoA carboxylase biotin carboxyl carrier protein